VSQNRVLRLFGISKGTFYYSKKGYPKARKSVTRSDEAVLSVIKEISRKRPTYGCPRVRAIARRDFGLSLTGYKTYTLMKVNGLLLRQKGERSMTREHTGKVSVSASNTRWSSDLTQIRLWNGKRLRFTYILDCCDRSILAYRVNHYMWAVDIEQMLQEALLKRFGQLPAPQPLEFLHDNGPEYMEHAFQKQLKEWNVVNCNTPTYSPQSNGMCEAFNGTFKRDYVYQNCLDNESEVRRMIGEWVEDYNTFAPHSALGMMSPQDFFNLKSAA
jgi:putative transposase